MKQKSFLLSYHRVSSSSSNLAAAMLKVQQNLLSRVLLFGGVCPAPVSLVNIHKHCLSVYVRTSEILYIVNIQKYKLRMLMNTPILSLTP